MDSSSHILITPSFVLDLQKLIKPKGESGSGKTTSTMTTCQIEVGEGTEGRCKPNVPIAKHGSFKALLISSHACPKPQSQRAKPYMSAA